MRTFASLAKLASLSLLLVSTSSPVFAAESKLTIYVYPPSLGLSWETPNALLGSFVKGALVRSLKMNDFVKFTNPWKESGTISSDYISSMGHTIGHVSCDLPSGEHFERWSSFSGQDYSEADNYVQKQQLGMGALFFKFIDGHIISGDENIKRLTFYEGKGGAAPKYLQFSLSADECAKAAHMVTFFESFHFKVGTPYSELQSRPKNKYLYFSTQDPFETYMARQKDPNAEVGGGCAPYGAALMKVTGKYNNELFEKYFRRNLKISEKLIGGIRDVKTGDINRVKIISLTDRSLFLDNTGTSWTHAGYPNRDLSLYDPQLIWNFIGKVQACLNNEPCPSDIQQWLNANRSEIHEGPVQTFRADYLARVAVGNPKGSGGPRYKVVQKSRTQTVHGVNIN